MKKSILFNTQVTDISYPELFILLNQWIKESSFRYIITLNPQILVGSLKNNDLVSFLKQADLCVADGIGIQLASVLINHKRIKKVTGVDLVLSVLKNIKTSIYLVGTKESVIHQAVMRIKTDYPNIKICGYHHGFFSPNEEKKIIEDIKNASNIGLKTTHIKSQM